jgi:hypothetical protein
VFVVGELPNQLAGSTNWHCTSMVMLSATGGESIKLLNTVYSEEASHCIMGKSFTLSQYPPPVSFLR